MSLHRHDYLPRGIAKAKADGASEVHHAGAWQP
jgi:hypothetical protein